MPYPLIQIDDFLGTALGKEEVELALQWKRREMAAARVAEYDHLH